MDSRNAYRQVMRCACIDVQILMIWSLRQSSYRLSASNNPLSTNWRQCSMAFSNSKLLARMCHRDKLSMVRLMLLMKRE